MRRKPLRDTRDGQVSSEPTRKEWVLAIGLACVVVVLTRLPVARLGPIETDEFGYLAILERYALPPHHTLFLAAGRIVGRVVGDPYFGFVVLDMGTSALALIAAWWWLRGLVRPSVAASGTALLAFAPVFWTYGALAGNYTAIVAVGCTLLGIIARAPRPWHPWLAAVVLALGTGYRQDIGTLWLPVFGGIMFRHRWRAAIGPVCLFTILNLTWIAAMLWSVGGWSRYREITAEFAHSAGYLNSAFHLGWIDAPLRYSVKLAMALVGTFGLALIVIPRGLTRLAHKQPYLLTIMILSILPAFIMHMLIHFGVPGYAMHYVPALLGLIAVGVGRAADLDHASGRLATLACLSALVFLLYPTDYERGGRWGDFDMAFARSTRVGLRRPMSIVGPQTWRTINSSRIAEGDHVH